MFLKTHLSLISVSPIPISPAPWARPKSCERMRLKTCSKMEWATRQSAGRLGEKVTAVNYLEVEEA